jgi:hypothetical protein
MRDELLGYLAELRDVVNELHKEEELTAIE